MILFLNGSPRLQSVSTAILRTIQAEAEKTSTVEWLDVSNLRVQPCTGCEGCRPNGECVLPEDDGHRVGKLLGSCSALVVGTPTYWGNMSGPLKALFDRNVTAIEHCDKGMIPTPLHRGKKAILVTACNAPFPFSMMLSHGRGAIRSLRTIVKAGGFNVLKTITISSASRFEKTSVKWTSRAKAIGRKLGAVNSRS